MPSINETFISSQAVLPIQLTHSQVRPVAYRILSKKHGLNLKSSALDVLTEFLGHNFGVDWRGAKSEKFLDEISRRWKDQDRGLFLEGPSLKEIIRDIVNSENDNSDQPIPAQKSNTIADNPKQSQKTAYSSWEDYFKVINCEHQPNYTFDAVKKNFDIPKSTPSLLAPAINQASLFVTRYNLIYSRILRNESFQTPSFSSNVNTSMAESKFYSITMIHNMLGRNDQEFLLFGFITKGADGGYWLQDTSGKVLLDLSQAIPVEGIYYTTGQFLLCNGIYFNEKFIIATIGPPPIEKREATKTAYGNIDFLGVHTVSTTRSRVERIDRTLEKQLSLQERQHPNHRIIILGMNIFLDQLKTIDALRRLFNHIQQQVDLGEREELPISIIFPGSFKSTPFQSSGNSIQYKESFDFLAQLLREFPKISSQCKLIFVPGDNDAWASTFSSGATPLFPLQPIPNLFINRIKRISPHAVFTSNPSKITYLSQEIVFMRDDIGSRFRRNSILFPYTAPETEDPEVTMEIDESDKILLDIEDMEDIDEEDILSQKRALNKLVHDSSKNIKPTNKAYIPPDTAEARKVIKTILDQGHLSPFPLSIRPVAWDYDYTLSLTPLPSVVILADISTPPFKATYEGCHVINPGPLIQGNKICWVEYNPSRVTSEQNFLYI